MPWAARISLPRRAWPATSSTSPATSTGWSSTTTTGWRSAPRCRATSRSPTRIRALFPPSRWIASRALPEPPAATRDPDQRQPGKDSPPAQPALRRAGPAAGRLRALLGDGIVARLSEPLRAFGPSTPATPADSTSIRISRCRSAAGGWSSVPEVAVRETAYTISQTPDLTGAQRRCSHHQPRPAQPERF